MTTFEACKTVRCQPRVLVLFALLTNADAMILLLHTAFPHDFFRVFKATKLQILKSALEPDAGTKFLLSPFKGDLMAASVGYSRSTICENVGAPTSYCDN